jgi:hypothetical protein
MNICRAGYHTTSDNQTAVKMLAGVLASKFHYAQDTLCLPVGAEIRLIKNLNVNAGLVNNATGRVIEVLYDNADVDALLAGKCPPPYCVVVDFPEFRGFPEPDGTGMEYPFVDQKSWVPLFRQKF